MYFRRKQSRGRIYLQIVESHRSGDQARQRVVAALGRLDELEASGQLDRVRASSSRRWCSTLPEPAMPILSRCGASARRTAVAGDRLPQRDHCIGAWSRPSLLIGTCGVSQRAASADSWRLGSGGRSLAEDYRIIGSDALELHPLYRAMAWLGVQFGNMTDTCSGT
jgi:hypothetical protein